MRFPIGNPDRCACIKRRWADFVTQTVGALFQPASRIGSTCIKRRWADFVTQTVGALFQPASRIGSTCAGQIEGEGGIIGGNSAHKSYRLRRLQAC